MSILPLFLILNSYFIMMKQRCWDLGTTIGTSIGTSIGKAIGAAIEKEVIDRRQRLIDRRRRQTHLDRRRMHAYTRSSHLRREMEKRRTKYIQKFGIKKQNHNWNN